ncbi:MFS transporter [Actinomadura sp. 6N118]|uniref:MFS transporter n=1 Tax=Actinomadura sp. 6N118 TaxID=3375151 RepID=UPI0037AD1BE9
MLLSLVLLASVASSGSLTVVSLFARDELGASAVMVTIYFVVVALSGGLVLLVTGRLSDRGQLRRVLISASLAWLAIGYGLLTAAHSILAMLLIGIVFISALNIANAQLLAHARDVLNDQAHPHQSIFMVSLVRVVFSIGSLLGFSGGGVGLAWLGARAVFALTAFIYLLCLGLSFISLDRRLTPLRPPDRGTNGGYDRPTERAEGVHSEENPDADTGTNSLRLLALFSLLMVLFASGRVMQVSQLPIVVHESLGGGLEWVGLILAIPPFVELALMPAMAWAASRWGRGNIFLIGAFASVVYYGGVAVAESRWQLIVLQGCYAVFGAAAIMVGIDIGQRLMTNRPGLATSSYLSHENLAVVTGSIVATTSVAAFGNRTGFLMPAFLCLAALSMTALLFARYPARFDLRPLHSRLPRRKRTAP